MKYVVRIVALIAVAFALYVIVGEQLVGTSGTAYVNAELAESRAPLSGYVALDALRPGTRVQSGETLGNVTARAATVARVDSLNEALALARADRDALAERAEGGSEETEIDLTLETLRAEARLAALESLSEQASVEQSRRLSGALQSPASGIVWSTPVNDGEFVVEGNTVSIIADCATAFVHAGVDERLYNRLSIGDVAQFRFHDGPVIEATVSLLGGTGPRQLYDTLAIAPPQSLTDGYLVLLSAPALAGPDSCQLGRSGRVVFTEGPLSFLTGLWDRAGS
ncbi:HlyD family efflux transporter periplasmic adaptor subunit [Pelagibacterium montanilacus]|uniref:HlyD family efflux transporter periplasmic adaptor subunit n=1 Tax=Pelagibacterium montanilacus TaxID=2185280 RepID=UPI000F8C8DD5|nr:HlyD family efflux transporter periplasmic adaptor subunit [Pelagibacterium montanilacus]